jgi:subtilisin family serine protease
MAEERRPYIVGVKKIASEGRDTFRNYVPDPESMYHDIDGGDDEERELGEPARYRVDLTEEGYEAFSAASNLRYIEPDEQDRALSLEDGVEASALEFHRLYGIEDRGYFGQDVIVGVGDTGLDLAYLDGYFEGRVEAVWSYYGDDGADRQGHGTWCCGAAVPSGARLISGKVLSDSGLGDRSKITKFGYDFAKLCRRRRRRGVLSYSLGGPGYSQAYEDMIQTALRNGVVVVCAAGNDGRNPGDDQVGAPANSPSAIAVAAIDHRTGRMADFSSRGPEVDVAAAGVDLLGLAVGGGETRMSGTSMATPIVARVVACLLSTGRPVQEVRGALLAGTVDTNYPVTSEGRGVVKALKALGKLPLAQAA